MTQIRRSHGTSSYLDPCIHPSCLELTPTKNIENMVVKIKRQHVKLPLWGLYFLDCNDVLFLCSSLMLAVPSSHLCPTLKALGYPPGVRAHDGLRLRQWREHPPCYGQEPSHMASPKSQHGYGKSMEIL